MSALKDDLALMRALLDLALHEPHGKAVSDARILIDDMLMHVRDELKTGPTDGDHFNRPDTIDEVRRKVASLKMRVRRRKLRSATTQEKSK